MSSPFPVISNLATLTATVVKWTEQDDVADVILPVVQLAEKRINRELRVREMVQSQTGNLVAETLAVPSAFNEMQSFQLTGQTPPRVLEYRPPDEFFEARQSQAGPPKLYTIDGGSFYFYPQPGSDGVPYRLAYYSDVSPSLTTTQTNWLIVRAPDLYLYGCLLELQPYLRDATGKEIYQEAFSSAIATLHRQDQRARSRGGMQRTRVQGIRTP